jgi:uncharacterized membrane protein
MSRPGRREREGPAPSAPPQRREPKASRHDAEAGREGNARPLGWLPKATLVLSIIGLVDSGYQVYTHFSGTGLLGCSARADACVLVQNSIYAWVFGVPVAVLGAVFYAFMVVICSPPAWRSRWPAVGWSRLVAVVAGMLFVLYLMFREIISLGRICPYCTSVHVITFVLFVLILFAATGVVRTPGPSAPLGARF